MPTSRLTLFIPVGECQLLGWHRLFRWVSANLWIITSCILRWNCVVWQASVIFLVMILVGWVASISWIMAQLRLTLRKNTLMLYFIPDVCSENGSGRFLRNVDNHLPHHTVSQLRRLRNINLENRKEMLSRIYNKPRPVLPVFLIDSEILSPDTTLCGKWSHKLKAIRGRVRGAAATTTAGVTQSLCDLRINSTYQRLLYFISSLSEPIGCQQSGFGSQIKLLVNRDCRRQNKQTTYRTET